MEQKELTKEEIASKEKERIMILLLKNRASMASDYKNTIRHTGGLLTQSMVYAYSKGLEAAFKLVSKGDQDEKPVQEK